MAPPQSNGELVKIARAGAAASDDWDVPAPAGADGPDKWAGRIRVYYTETVRRDTTGGELNVFVARIAWADTAELPIELDTNDVVTLELDDGRTVTSPAKTIARSSLAGYGPVSTTRVDLEDG